MNILWLLIGVLHAFSLMFMGVCLAKLYYYTQKYTLEETPDTRLFRRIQLRHVVVGYVIFIVVFTVGSMIFISMLNE